MSARERRRQILLGQGGDSFWKIPHEEMLRVAKMTFDQCLTRAQEIVGTRPAA